MERCLRQPLGSLTAYTVPEASSIFASLLGSFIVLFMALLFLSLLIMRSFAEVYVVLLALRSILYLFFVPAIFVALAIRTLEHFPCCSIILFLFLTMFFSNTSFGEEGILSNVLFFSSLALMATGHSALFCRVFEVRESVTARLFMSALSLFVVNGATAPYSGPGHTYLLTTLIFYLLVCVPYELGLRALEIEGGGQPTYPTGCWLPQSLQQDLGQ